MVYIQCGPTLQLQLIQTPVEIYRINVLKDNELNSTYINPNLHMEKYGKIAKADFDSSIDSERSASNSNNTEVNGSSQKQKKAEEKDKCTLLSNKECLENKIHQGNKTVKLKNELFCTICDLNFTCFESFKEHKDKKEFLCRLCTEEFNSHDELETHFCTHNKVRCKTCKEEFFTNKELFRHRKKMHIARKIECSVCLKTFTTPYGLRIHVKRRHSQCDGNCICVVCGKNLKYSIQLKQHLERVHTAHEHVECKYCRVLYLGPYKLQAHIKAIHLGLEKNTPVSCSTCGKVFDRASGLEKHQETHEKIDSVCEICGKLIKTKSLMICHMESQHPKTGTFTCKICNEQFENRKDFRKHTKLQHYKQTKSNSVFCEICGKVYKNSHVLKLHKAIHADERPFKCEVCGATFKQAVALRTHQRVHSSTGKYTCKGCGNNFKWKQTFDKHLSKCGSNEIDSIMDSEDK